MKILNYTLTDEQFAAGMSAFSQGRAAVVQALIKAGVPESWIILEANESLPRPALLTNTLPGLAANYIMGIARSHKEK